MTLLIAALAAFTIGGFAALVSSRSPHAATRIGVGSAVLGSALGLVPAIGVLTGRPEQSFHLEWSVPGGAFFVGLDPLSSFFLVPIFGLAALAAIYGSEYLLAHRGRHAVGPPWFFFNLLVAGMALVVMARNALLFLVAWEVMSLASYFLVTFEAERKEVRDAGWTYLVATHLGTAFLLALFVLLGRETGTGSLDFDHFGSGAAGGSSLLFLLALIGFGTKAGFMPLHVWLPEAHPAAPSHVSAVMSGVMIKTGIYGLLRVLTFLGPPPGWWGGVLVAIGITSGILGVLFALAQHDLKRLLAYSSVENIGIIALGLGIGLVGMSAGSPTLIVLGFGGALFHVLNHAIFKGLLFLGAGTVVGATGTSEIDHLGGLLRRMPWSGAAFLIGAVAISGLPPLNGVTSEFLIYLGAFAGVISLNATNAAALLLGIVALAVIGGLAAACFTKAFGMVFLGEPRSEAARDGREPGWAMRGPMVTLGAACIVLGVFPQLMLGALGRAVAIVAGVEPALVLSALDAPARSLTGITVAAAALLAFTGAIALLRRRLLAGRAITDAVTWDCGYSTPSPRMQYTASSYARPITAMFDFVLRSHRRVVPPHGFFPVESSLATETPDLGRERIFRPAFHAVAWGLARFRWIQNGRLHLYVLYIAITLLVLLVWRLP